MSSRLAAICAAAACLLATLVASTAHEGHDHAPGPSLATTGKTSTPRTEAASSAFEIVAVLVGGELRIWVDTFETNEPITGATVEVESPAGPASAAATTDGAYAAPAPWAKAPGRHELTFTIVDGGNVDVLTAAIDVPAPAEARPLNTEGAAAAALRPGDVLAAAGVAGLLLGVASAGALRRRPLIWAPALGLAMLAMFGAARLFAHEGHDHGEQGTAVQVPGDRAQILADGSVFLPKPTQRVIAVRTELGRGAQHAKRIELPGRIIPDPNHSGLVQTAAPGRLSPPEGGFPRLGARVQAGEVLAFVATPFQAIDQSTMRQQQGDLDQQISIAERRLARYETLLKTGAVSQVLLEETRLELQGLRDRRRALDSSKSQPEALRAPVDGVVAASNAVAGQIADTSAVVFHIVDPKRLFVEALSHDGAEVAGQASALATTGNSLPLTFVGAGLADRNQARPIHYAVDGDTHGLRLGQFVTVLARTTEEASGLAVPRASVVRRGNGENIVYRHATAERFEPRIVRTEPLDAERVLIIAGVDPGARIVTQAAELLNQVR